MVREALNIERLHAMVPEEAAAHLLVRRAEGLSAQEEALVTEWLSADAANAAALEQAGRAWNVFDDNPANEWLGAMREHALHRPAHRSSSWRKFAAIAAVLMLMIGSGWLLMVQSGRQSPAIPANTIRYVAEREAIKEIALPDGSRMTLDANSSAIGRFGPSGRSIRLERGRAFFAVKHDAASPFTVDAEEQRITAIGTQFDVSLTSRELAVTLVEGRVTIGAPSSKAALVTLEPGQQFVLRGGKAAVTILGDGASAKTGWRQGLLNFDNEPLSGVVAEANRYSHQKIVIHDAQVAGLRISGQFRAGDAQRFASTIADLYRLHAVKQGDTIELKEK